MEEEGANLLQRATNQRPLADAPLPSGHPATRPQTLIDGTMVQTRPIQPGDALALQRFHRRLSTQSVYMRFFHAVPVLTDELAAYYTQLDGVDRYALVALDPTQPDEIIGVVRYDREPGTDQAEYAIVVADRWQGRGLGLGLTRRVAITARHHGIRYLWAYVLPENRRMLDLFKQLGMTVQSRLDEGCVLVKIDLQARRGTPAI
jgi:RimJ/RimL family protein N-acetyltransferase